MTDGPTYLQFHVEAHCQTIRIPMFRGSTLEEKFLLWKSTEDDTDFDDLVAWVNDEIAEQLDYYVEDVD
jgi:hypothetical protein